MQNRRPKERIIVGLIFLSIMMTFNAFVMTKTRCFCRQGFWLFYKTLKIDPAFFCTSLKPALVCKTDPSFAVCK